jgi:hypothetical protein
VTIVGCETELVGVLDGATHPGAGATSAKSIDAVVSHTKRDQSRVHSVSLASPTRMSKSQSQIVMVLNPRKPRLSRLLYG